MQLGRASSYRLPTGGLSIVGALSFAHTIPPIVLIGNDLNRVSVTATGMSAVPMVAKRARSVVLATSYQQFRDVRTNTPCFIPSS